MFETWLKTPGAFRCVLIELETDTGTRYFSNSAYQTGANDIPANTPYDPFVIGGLEITRSMSEVFSGVSSSLISDLELIKNDDTLNIGDVNEKNIKIFFGDKAWLKSEFQLVMHGVIDEMTPETDKIRIAFRELSQTLVIPVLSEVYDSGPSEGEIKPLCLGRCFNIAPVLIDATNHIYQFNTVTSKALTKAKFNGDTVAPANYIVDLAQSTIQFLIKPVGNITLDVDGAVITGAWLQTATDFINYLMATRLIQTTQISNLATYQLGCYITNNMQYGALLDEICASVGAYWFYNRLGVFTCSAFVGTTGIATDELTDDQNIQHSRNQRRRISPLKQLTLGYQKNWSPLENVAPVVFDTDPALAQQLNKTESVHSKSQSNNGDAITVSTLISNKVDAQTETERRLQLKSLTRYVYETEQLAGPLNWHLGDELTLETPAKNGERCIITRLSENLLNGRCILEFWQ
jgi:hypothetical protein